MYDIGPTQILVVDDEPDLEILIKQRFRKQIRESKFHFRFSSNGKEALEQLELNPELEIILCDINMPVMDGLTLLSELAERTDLPTVKTVMVSAYQDMKNIRTAMNRGAFDFITKPIDFSDLEATIGKTLNEVRSFKRSQATKQ